MYDGPKGSSPAGSATRIDAVYRLRYLTHRADRRSGSGVPKKLPLLYNLSSLPSLASNVER